MGLEREPGGRDGLEEMGDGATMQIKKQFKMGMKGQMNMQMKPRLHRQFRLQKQTAP